MSQNNTIIHHLMARRVKIFTLAVGIVVGSGSAFCDDTVTSEESSLPAAKAALPLPAFIGSSRSPASVSPGGQITFETRLSNPSSAQKVELVFTDANVSEAMDKVASDTWRKVRAMTSAGNNRPFQIRITTSNGQVITGGSGTYTVTAAQAAPLLPASAGVSASPSSVPVNGQITFETRLSNPSSAQKVELVFTDANVSEAMDKVASDTWRKVRAMTSAGNNRPFQIRITASNGQVITGGTGSYSVQAAQAPAGSLADWQKANLDYANNYLKSNGTVPLASVFGNTCGQYTYCYAWSRNAPGSKLPGGMGTAVNAFQKLPERGYKVIANTNFANAPIGAVVFFSIGTAGHAAIKVDAENIVSQGQHSAKDCTISKVAYNKMGAYLGYYAPGPGSTALTDPNLIDAAYQVSREEFLKGISEALKVAAPELPASYLDTARQMAIVQNPDSYSPATPIIRQDAAAMMSKAIAFLESKGWKFSAAGDVNRFVNDPDIKTLEIRSLASRMAQLGLFMGTVQEDGSFQFEGPRQLSKSESSALVSRFKTLLASAGKTPLSIPVPAVTSATATPAIVSANGQVLFEARISNPASVQKVEVVFSDVANVFEAMDKVAADMWRRSRAMTGTGTNRPFQIRVTTLTGQVITGGNGTYTVSTPAPATSCWDGTTVPAGQACPAQMKKCSDGTSIPVANTCPPPVVSCWNGTTAATTQACPPQMKACPDGNSVPVEQNCPVSATVCPNGTTVPFGQACALVSVTNVSVGVSNTAPPLGSRVDVNLFGTLSSTSASDIYLYMKQADSGAIYFWHSKQFNEFPKPWRAGVLGPNLPETNPIFSFDVKQAGNYAAGVLVLPAGAPVNMSTATEQALTVR